MVTSTSLNAYFNFALPKLSEHQMVVLNALLKGGPMTNKEIRSYLGEGWDINMITPRTGELYKKKLLLRHDGARKEVGKPAQNVYEIAPATQELKTRGVPRVYLEGRTLSNNQTLF